MKKMTKTWIAALALAGLAACGGGGGDESADAGSGGNEPTPTPTLSAEGAWLGTTSTGADLALLITESNEAWGLYVDQQTGGFGMIHGAGSVQGNVFTAVGKDYDGLSGAPVEGTVSATFVEKTTIDGTASGAGNVSFSAEYVPEYEQAADISLVAKNWTMAAASGFTATVAISNAGAISGVTPIGGACQVSGQMTPHPSKNYFTTEITFANDPACLFPGLTMNGVTIVDGDDVDAALLVGLVDGDKSFGLTLVGLPPAE